MSIAVKQAKLAKKLFQIDDAILLDEITLLIEQAIAGYKRKPKQKYLKKGEIDLQDVSLQYTPYHISLEDLVKEQKYDSKKFGQAVDKIEYHLFQDETLEDMLNTLSA
ncbi:MAG: hypothetical protein R3E32_04355 [Chitinophagales bacterium]